MNPENASQVTNPPPEAPSPGRPAETGEARQNKPGFLRRFARIGERFDRGLGLEGRDTSDWNIYYYYFRQVAQHHAPIKLRHLKWIALLFQLYFFGMLALALIRVLLILLKSGGKHNEAFRELLGGFASILGISANIYILPVLLLVPVFMVIPAFRLRNKAQGFMTSRAKEPPLLAHLVQYTTNKGLVQGALQSLLFTWKRFVLLLLPAIVVALLMLIGFAAIDHTKWTFILAFAAPVGVVLSVLTISLFFVMQPFCYRLDSLLVAICIGIETVTLAMLGFDAKNASDFWILFSVCYVPSCLFGCVYFPLAAADTGEYGLGKCPSKRIRILLYAAAGFFLAGLLLTNAFPALLNRTGNHAVLNEHRELFRVFLIYFMWGLCVCICCLLVTSMSVTSLLAEQQRRINAKGSFLRKLFDPASPLSLLPVIALELIVLATMFLSVRVFMRTEGGYHGLLGSAILYSLSSLGRIRNAWTAIHFGLALAYASQRRKPEMKAPWEFHVRFNMICIIGYVAIQLLLALTTRTGAGFIGLVLYIVSIIVLFTVFGLLKSSASTYKVGVPPAEQDHGKEEAS